MLSKLKQLFLPHGATPSSSRRARFCRPMVEVLEERQLLSANLFGVGGDGRVYEQKLDPHGHASTNWSPTSSSGQIISDVSMSKDAYGGMHLFGVGGYGQVYEQDLDAYGNPSQRSWYPTAQAAQIVSSVSISGDGKHLFGVGGDKRVYEQDLGADGHPLASWYLTSPTHQIQSNVTVNGAHLFGVGGDGKVYVMTFTGYGTDWSLVDSNNFIAGDVSVSADGRFLFGVGGDGKVYLHGLDASGNGFGAWWPTSDTGYIASNVTVGTDASGNMHLFGLGADGKVFEQDLDASGHPLGGWYSTNPWTGLASNVTLSSDAYGNMHLFSVGRDRRVYEMDLDANDHAVTGWFATSSSGAIYSDASLGGGYGYSTGVSVLGGLTYEPAARRLYFPANGTLFYSSILPSPKDGVPSYLDVQQGGIGDCWLMAGLAEVAARNPGDITSMITPAGTATRDGFTVNLYNVRLYDTSGVAHFITVDDELPMGGSYYDKPVGGPSAVNGSISPVLWVALAEKAYAKAIAYGFVQCKYGTGFGSYDSLNNGHATWALQAITGKGADEWGVGPLSFVDPATEWSKGRLVTFGTDSPTDSHIVDHHAYAMVNYDPSSSTPFQIFNPWGTASNGWVGGTVGGTYGLFWANRTEVWANFNTQTFGDGAAPGRPESPHALSSRQSADVVFLGDLRDALAKTLSSSSPSYLAPPPGSLSPLRFDSPALLATSSQKSDALFALAAAADLGAAPKSPPPPEPSTATHTAHDPLLWHDQLWSLNWALLGADMSNQEG